MKKKVISILLTAVLATGMAACGSNSNTAGNSANNTADNAQNTAETSTESTGSADSAEKPVLMSAWRELMLHTPTTMKMVL